MKFIFLVFMLISSSFAFSNERVFLLSDATDSDLMIQRDFSYFNRLELNSYLLEEHFNFKGNYRDSIIQWLKETGMVVLGNKFNYHVCFNKKVSGTNLVPCNDNYNPRQSSLKSVVKSSLLDKNYSLFFPKATLDKKGIDGGFVLSNGKMIQFKGYSPAIILENELKADTLRLDEEAMSLYRVAHFMGLMRTKEVFILGNEKGWEMCDALTGKIKCELNKDGAFALTGLMLSLFAKECVSCSQTSKVMLNFYAINYLLRVPGSNDFQLLGRKLYMQNRADIRTLSKPDYSSLEMLYRWALSSQLSAH